MNSQKKIGALALAAALLLTTPSTFIASSALAGTRLAQQDDVPSDAEQSMFTKGQNLYLQGRYEQAVTVLQEFLKTYPKSIISDLTLLWLGRSFMQLGRFQEAEQVGQRLHAIKDTPFADIYDGELQTARREAPARGNTGPANVNNTVAANTESRGTTPSSTVKTPVTQPRTSTQTATSTPTQRQTQTETIAKATPTPTPARTPQVTANKAATEQPRQITPSVNANRSAVTTPPQARLAETATARTSTERPITPAEARRNRQRELRERRLAQQRAATETNTAANLPRTTTQQTNSRPPANQVAINIPTRTVTPPVKPSANNTARETINPPVTNTGVTPSANVETSVESSASASQGGLNLTVKQVPNLVLALRRASEAASPGQTVQIPLTITNTGNKEDQFRLETDLPAEFQPTFSLAQGGSDTGLPILVTPQLARNAAVEVLLNLRVPETATDGQQRRFIVRAASQSDYQVLRVADGAINVVSATLAGVSGVSQTTVMPGETFTQTISIRNSGSAPAQRSRADFVFNPNFELVSANPSPLVYDRPSRTAIWDLGSLNTRDSRDITVTLRAVPNALAATNSLGRGTVRTQSLPFGANFDSPTVTVGKVPAARIDAVSVGLTATPGDAVFIPFVVRNPGNAPDSYELRLTAPGAPQATIYADTNGDGQHQESEPAITQTSQLDPQGGQYPLLLRVQIPANTPDRQQYSYNLVARSLTSNRVASEANTVLTVATPRVRVRTEQVTDSSAPGDTIFYRLVLVNEGSGLAKNLVVTEMIPDALQFVNSDPQLNPQDASGNAQRIIWRVPELAPGDTTVLRIAVRLRPNLQADQNLTTRRTLSYQDSNGNNYQGQ